MTRPYQLPPKFIGDGRTKVIYTQQPIGTNSMALTKAQARAHIERLYASGRANHSATGVILWVTLEALHYNLTPYTMQVVPGMGFSVSIDAT